MSGIPLYAGSLMVCTASPDVSRPGFFYHIRSRRGNGIYAPCRRRVC